MGVEAASKWKQHKNTSHQVPHMLTGAGKKRQEPGNSIIPGATHADSSEVRFRAQRGGQANIGNFGVVAICQQHVGGLDVEVDPAAAVQEM